MRELKLIRSEDGFYMIDLIGMDDEAFDEVAFISPTSITLGHLGNFFSEFNKFIVLNTGLIVVVQNRILISGYGSER